MTTDLSPLSTKSDRENSQGCVLLICKSRMLQAGLHKSPCMDSHDLYLRWINRAGSWPQFLPDAQAARFNSNLSIPTIPLQKEKDS